MLARPVHGENDNQVAPGEEQKAENSLLHFADGF